MGVSQQHALPRERKFYAKRETTLGVPAQPAAIDAVKVLGGTQFGSAAITRSDRNDNRTTRDVLERITGNIDPIDFTVEAYLIPSGAAGTAPDIGEVIKHAMGVETVSGGVAVTYALTDTQGVQDSLTLVDQVSQVFSEHLLGSVGQEMKISGSGGRS